MKKQLLIAAIAATMSVASVADISIKGDAYVSFFNNNDGGATSKQRVRLNVVGKAGATKVKAVIRNNGNTAAGGDSTGAYIDQLFITTKAGSANIKAGDFYGTIGLGARSKGGSKKNALSVSTKIGGWKVGAFTHGASGLDPQSNNISLVGKVAGATLKVVHNPNNFTDIAVKGTFKGISVAAERWDDATATNNDTTLIHIGGKFKGVKWDIAQLKNSHAHGAAVAAVSTVTAVAAVTAANVTANILALAAAENAFEAAGTDANYAALLLARAKPLAVAAAVTAVTATAAVTGTGFTNTKFSPLGSHLLGKSVNDTAVDNVGAFSKIIAVSGAMKISGNNAKVILGKLYGGTNAPDAKRSFQEIIFTRPLAGATLDASWGKVASDGAVNSVTSKGVKLTVKF